MTQLSTLAGRLLDQELGTDDDTILFTTARRQSAINDGQKEFADLTECLIRVSTVVVTGGTAEYNLNSTSVTDGDFMRLAADQSPEFHYTDASSHTQYLSGPDFQQKTVRWLNEQSLGWRSSTGSSGPQLPSQWYLRPDDDGLYFGMVPCPSTGSSATAIALVPYVALPAPMTSSTAEPFTVSSAVRTDLRPYHMALVHYAAHSLEKLRRDDQASDRQLQKFMGYVTRYLQSMRKKGGTMVTYSRNYFTRGREAVGDPRT